MKKMYANKERVLCVVFVAVFSVVLLLLIVNFHDNVAAVVLSYIDIVFIASAGLKLFCIPSHILIIDDRVKVYDFPFFATNKYYVKQKGLIMWNSEINIEEVKNAELVELAQYDKIKYVGYAHLCNRYIKVNLQNSSSAKYIYISFYSKSQTKNLLNYLNNKNTIG